MIFLIAGSILLSLLVSIGLIGCIKLISKNNGKKSIVRYKFRACYDNNKGI